MTEQEAKEFMAKPLPERFHDFMLMEMCDEDGNSIEFSEVGTLYLNEK